VVFSALFGKKKDKEPQRPAKPTPSSVSSSASRSSSSRSAVAAGANTEAPTTSGGAGPTTTIPPSAREIARATAEKIDKIESEMTLDYTGRNTQPGRPKPASQGSPLTTSDYGQTSSSFTTSQTGSPSTVTRKRSKRGDGSTTLPSLGQTTDILLGDSILANAMELTDSASSPAIEEAAILYANGQPLPAVAVLVEAVKSDTGAHANSQAWSMLFELYQVLGKRAEFENLAIDYAVRFETSAPAWSDNPAPAAAPPAQVAPPPGRSTVVFKGVLGTNVVPQLDQLKRLAQKSPVLHLDFSQITGADTSGADLILRVFAAFQKSNHEVIIEGAASLAERLLACIEVGRRDPSNAIWMLLLEMYRVLGRQAAFEETSIDYCVTYEVSPPSWEAPSTKFKIGESALPAVVEPADEPQPEVVEMPVDTMALAGDLLGKAEPELTRLTNFAAEHRRIVVDCSKLRRVDFTAAGVLLNWAVGAQSMSKAIEFRDVSNLVAALLVVMGLHEVAQIERRKL